jgi:mono/diheme cytochrome c family protein
VHKLFAVLGGALIILVIITVWLELRPEWVRHQKDYQAWLGKKAEPDNAGFRVKQDWLPDLHRTDRCRTCHLGIEDTLFQNAREPLRTHPPIPNHDFNKFGCTVCHEGQGRATTVQAAHGPVDNWKYPLLPKQVLEGACGRCHQDKLSGQGSILTQGRQLIGQYGCTGCHKVAGIAPPEYIGPDLNRVAEKVTPSWLVSWIRDPREYLPKTTMPNYKLTREEAREIASYLMHYRPVQAASDGGAGAGAEKLAETGKLLFSQSRCVSCHALDGKGGTLGPDLGRIGDKIERDWLGPWLGSPQAYFPKTRMPHFNFTPPEIAALTEYMLQDLSNGDYPPDPTVLDSSSRVVEKGKKLIIKYGCTGCHAVPGISDTGREIGPSLVTIGAKTLDQFLFGEEKIERTVPNWMFVKLLRPRAFGRELVMPDYGLKPVEALAMTNVLMGQVPENIPSPYLRKPAVPVMRPLSGPIAAVVNKYRCFICHSIDGAGGTLAPDLTMEGSIVKRDWLIQYLAKPDVIRPFLVERMPKFNLSRAESETIADYLMAATRHDSIPTPEEWTGAGDPALGRKLYFEKYNCQSCHTLGKTGGYYGPPLDNVGARLEPAWIYARLLDAHRFQTDSREPRLVFHTEDALALTGFLSSIRQGK